MAEQGFGSRKPLASHQVLLAKHLLVERANNRVLILGGGNRPAFLIPIIGKAFNAKLGRTNQANRTRGKGELGRLLSPERSCIGPACYRKSRNIGLLLVA